MLSNAIIKRLFRRQNRFSFFSNDSFNSSFEGKKILYEEISSESVIPSFLKEAIEGQAVS